MNVKWGIVVFAAVMYTYILDVCISVYFSSCFTGSMFFNTAIGLLTTLGEIGPVARKMLFYAEDESRWYLPIYCYYYYCYYSQPYIND